MKKTVITFAFLLLAYRAQGAAPANMPIECDTLDEVNAKIEFCTENSRAVQSAADCVDKINRAVQAASVELAAAFGQDFLGTSGVGMQRQKRTFSTSSTDYQRAVNKLNFLIAESTRNLHYVASYPRAMLDDPDGHVPCYSENFDKLKPLIGDLDRKVTELKQARAANASLGAMVEGSSQRIENNGGHGPKGADLVNGGRAKNRDSGVSGTSKEEALGVQGKPAQPKFKATAKGTSVKGKNFEAGQENTAKESSVSSGSGPSSPGSSALDNRASERAFHEAVDQITVKAEVKAKFKKSDLDAAMDSFLVQRDKFGGVKGNGDILPDVSELDSGGAPAGLPSGAEKIAPAENNSGDGEIINAAGAKKNAAAADFVDDLSLFARVHRVLQKFPASN